MACLGLRDADPARYGGKGVLLAIQNIERILGPSVIGMDTADQAAIDKKLLEQGTGLGANATLAITNRPLPTALADPRKYYAKFKAWR